MQEFKQYGHYMQPRIHKMIQEVRASLPTQPNRYLAMLSRLLRGCCRVCTVVMTSRVAMLAV